MTKVKNNLLSRCCLETIFATDGVEIWVTSLCLSDIESSKPTEHWQH